MADTSEAETPNDLIAVYFPRPAVLRGGWAALAAVMVARGWGEDVHATDSEWRYHDGGGNWASLRFFAPDRAVLVGHDHEYSETYFGEAAEYFGEEETDLLAGAPEWWQTNLDPAPFGEWIGFIYGWDGYRWLRSRYDLPDGFTSVGLASACSLNDLDLLISCAADAPGLAGRAPDTAKLKTLIAADGKITEQMLDDAIPGWDSKAGAKAAQKFLLAPI